MINAASDPRTDCLNAESPLTPPTWSKLIIREILNAQQSHLNLKYSLKLRNSHCNTYMDSVFAMPAEAHSAYRLRLQHTVVLQE